MNTSNENNTGKILFILLGLALMIFGFFISNYTFFGYVIIFFGGFILYVLWSNKKEKTMAQKIKIANELFTYDIGRKSITLKKLDPRIKEFVKIEAERDLMVNYTPDKTIYTSVTVGGVTTGGFDTIKGGYSLSSGAKTGKYYLSYKYAQILNNEPMSDIICFAILSDDVFQAAMEDYHLKSLVASDNAKKFYNISDKNVLDLSSLTIRQAEVALNLFSGSNFGDRIMLDNAEIGYQQSFCSQCGSRLASNGSFCSNCGCPSIDNRQY